MISNIKNTVRKIIVISGPTASGKTGWGVEIAKKFNGEIISADSRQVYRGLDIGTGKDLGDFGDIKYHLIDIVEPETRFTMFDWLKLAKEAIEDIFARGKTPVIVGGTGLYIQALTEGFELEKVVSCHPELDSGSNSNRFRIKSGMTKKNSREDLEGKSLEELQTIYKKLKARSSKLEDMDLKNPYRLIRAIERAQSGEVVSKKRPDFEVLQIAIDMSREKLYQRIDQRAEEWFEEGFIEEIQGLLKSGVSPEWLEKIGLEYRILTEFLLRHPEFKSCHPESRLGGIEGSRDSSASPQNDSEFLEMKQDLKYKIHAFARRQLTWFRRFPEIIWSKDLRSAEEEIENFLL